MEVDITGTVLAWQQGDLDNFGLYSHANGYWDNTVFDSSESASMATRPELVVKYGVLPTYPVDPCTAFFKQGYKVENGEAVYDQVNGYAGMEDAYLDRYGYSRGGSAVMKFGGCPWCGDDSPGLMQFNDIFGSGEGQIPDSSLVTSATLRVYTTARVYTSGSGNYVGLRPMLTDWEPGTITFGNEEGASTQFYRYWRNDPCDYAAGDYWGTLTGAGTQGPLSPWDFDDSARISTYYPKDANFAVGWFEMDMTGIVQSWKMNGLCQQRYPLVIPERAGSLYSSIPPSTPT